MPQPTLKTFRDVVALWPTAAALARKLRQKPTNIRDWKARDKIPGKYWVAVVAQAQADGFRGVTIDRLIRITRAKKRESTGRGAPASAPATE